MKLNLLIIVLAAIILVQSRQQHSKQTLTQTKQVLVYKYLIFTQKCYKTFFNEQNLFDFQCIKKTAIKLLGYILVLGGAIIKLPQILKIIKLKSVKGISFMAVILQITTNILATGYSIYRGNPFSLYGENIFIGIQMLIIILMFCIYGKGSKIVYLTFFSIMIALSYYISDPHHLPSFIIENSIIVQTILLSTSRFTQILQVHKIKSVGSLAFSTFLLNVIGNIARITTVIFDAANDYKFLLSLIVITILNSYILFQFFLYRTSKAKQIIKQKTR